MIKEVNQRWKIEKRKATFKNMKNAQKSYLEMDLLRFTTAGSVDDGKSTLIGRLLYDTKSIFEDQLKSIEKVSKKTNGINFALLTDGLKEEREQGITIDVAYRYFATPQRKFIIADTPGHFEYTRNMITGASTANLALILVDVRHGVVEQTKRHSFIASMLGISHIVYCINKMDLVDYSEEKFLVLKKELQQFSSKLTSKDVRFIPMSALLGDNVVNRSEKMNWYEGGTLLHTLENIHIASDYNHIDCRFPIQYVIQSESIDTPNYIGYAGRIAGGVFKKGDEVMALPSGLTSKVSAIETMDGEIDEAFSPMSVTIRLENEMDLSRGDMLVRPNNSPEVRQDFDALICWLSDSPMKKNTEYIVQHTSTNTSCIVTEIKYKININTLHRMEDDKEVETNDITRVSIHASQPIFVDRYDRNRTTGSFILIDPLTNNTVAAGMIV